MKLLPTIYDDIRCKARWSYEATDQRSLLKATFTDGTMAMALYRLMQWSRHHRLTLLEMASNKLNAVFCNCIIGRGAEFGAGFVMIHSTGIVINGNVRGGRGILLEHQVTIGAQGRQSPLLGDNIFVGAGAKIIGGVSIGDGARIGANAVVLQDLPPATTAVGVPARIVVAQQSHALAA